LASRRHYRIVISP